MAEQKYKQGLRELKDRFGFDFVSLALNHGLNRPLLTWRYAAGNLSDRYLRIVLASGRGIAGMVFQAGHGMIIQSVRKEIPAMELTEFPIVITEKLESLYALPLWQGDEVKGILMMAFRRPDQITPDLFERILAAIKSGFCDFEVREHQYGQSLISMREHNLPEQVPVYELLPYHITQAREDERKQISRELHDSIAQEIASVQMRMRKAKYQKSREDILKIIDETDIHLGKIYTGLKNISVRLRPIVLEDLGLAAAFRSHFEWVEGTYNTLVRVKENIGSMRFNPEFEMIFYRVCQEAVLNACKYSGCDEIFVSLQQTKNSLCLEVVDHGFGFNVENTADMRTGVGFSSMMERAELIDGKLTINSAPGIGTSVYLSADIIA